MTTSKSVREKHIEPCLPAIRTASPQPYTSNTLSHGLHHAHSLGESPFRLLGINPPKLKPSPDSPLTNPFVISSKLLPRRTHFEVPFLASTPFLH